MRAEAPVALASVFVACAGTHCLLSWRCGLCSTISTRRRGVVSTDDECGRRGRCSDDTSLLSLSRLALFKRPKEHALPSDASSMEPNGLCGVSAIVQHRLRSPADQYGVSCTVTELSVCVHLCLSNVVHRRYPPRSLVSAIARRTLVVVCRGIKLMPALDLVCYFLCWDRLRSIVVGGPSARGSSLVSCDVCRARVSFVRVLVLALLLQHVFSAFGA